MKNKLPFIKISFIVSIVLLLACAYYNTLFNAKNEFKEGIKIIQKEPHKEKHPSADKHFQETIEKCWKLLEIYGDKNKYADDALLYIIKSEYYLKKYAQAQLHVKKFMNKYPDSPLIPEAYLWYGKILIKQEKEDEGKEYLHKCLALTQDSKIVAQVYYELGYLAFEKEDYEQSVEYFEKALKEKIDKQYAAFIQYYLGESYFQQKKYKDAISRFKKVEKYSPSLDIEYNTKFKSAKALSAIGKYKEALKILRKMLTAPRFKNFIPFIKTEIATIYDRQGKLDDAIELYKEVVRDRNSSAGTAQASYNLAKIYEYRIENVDSAVYYYGQVKKIYAKFDSVDQAEDKHIFLSELKKIRDSIKRDRYLVYRLETDPFFRDSLYKAQLEDSFRQELHKTSPRTLPDSSITATKPDSTLFSSLPDTTQNAQNQPVEPSPQDTAKTEEESGGEDFRRALLDEELGKPPNEGTKKTKDSGEKKTKKEVEKRKLPQIKEDLKKNEFHLAEYFLLKIQDYDSALFHYKKFLSTYQDSVLTPKALYSMYFIYSQPLYLDTLRQDSLANILITQYPESPFSRDILARKGLLKESESADSLDSIGHYLFRQAEILYEDNKIDSALILYKKVASLDSQLIWSAKAQLVVAWIYEHDLQNIEKAIDEYTYLKEHFTLPEFTSLATTKIAPPPKETITDTTDTSAVTPEPGILAGVDTTQAPLDTTRHKVATSSQLVEEDTGLPLISRTKRYRQWRYNRTRR